MFHILAAIAFVYLTVMFFSRALEISWGVAKIVASLFFVLAIPSLFIFVIIDSVVFLLLPLGFMLTAVDLVSVPVRAKSSR